MDKLSLLKKHFGHSEFRPGQEAMIDALLSGRDALGVMPTGAGKSVCYQLPALLLPGVTLVVSPLISLMKDQVGALTQAGICSAYLNSSLTAAQYRDVFRRALAGTYKIIYVAPERLATADFIHFALDMEISLIAVDEAHCVSQWGQDFRPSYLNIANYINNLSKRPVVGAFTATATAHVKDDIEKLLALCEPLRITTGFDRPNLFFEVMQPKSKDAYLGAFVAAKPEQSGIVCCSTHKMVELVCEKLCKSGVPATRYHAGLPDEERRQNQEAFIYDRVRVMVATNAFGMGIDKSNVSFVAHYNMPKNIESYYQEVGRAGRDGASAHCVLLYSSGDVQTARFLIENSEENEALSEKEQVQVRQRDLERLNKMVAYCKTAGCLRAFLLTYFGEAAPPKCSNCGSCTGETAETDITVEAQKILSAVCRIEKQHRSGLGVTVIVRMLRGSRDQRIIQLGLDKLPTYGIMRDTDRPRIREYIDHLVSKRYLVLDGSEYPVLRLTPKADDVLFHGETVTIIQRKQSAAEKSRSAKKGAKSMPIQEDGGLYVALKALRFQLAEEENAPAYVVFSNATLADMAAKQPMTTTAFLQVSGVGELKALKYAKAFLSEIKRWQEEHQNGR